MYIVVLLACSNVQQHGYTIIDMANSRSVTINVISVHLRNNGDVEYKMKIANNSHMIILVDVDELILSSSRIAFASKGVPFRIIKKESETITEIRGQRKAEIKPNDSLEVNRKFANYTIEKVGKDVMDPLLINEKRNDVVYSMYFMMDVFNAERRVIPLRVEGSGICTISYSLR